MSVRDEVRDLVAMGPLPDSRSVIADPALGDHIDRVHEAIEKIARPVTLEEARLLLGSFGPDDQKALKATVKGSVLTVQAADGGGPRPPPQRQRAAGRP